MKFSIKENFIISSAKAEETSFLPGLYQTQQIDSKILGTLLEMKSLSFRSSISPIFYLLGPSVSQFFHFFFLLPLFFNFSLLKNKVNKLLKI